VAGGRRDLRLAGASGPQKERGGKADRGEPRRADDPIRFVQTILLDGATPLDQVSNVGPECDGGVTVVLRMDARYPCPGLV
jgi:hypothetical protein